MRFKKPSLIEALEVSQVASIELLAMEGLDQGSDLFALFAHAWSLECKGKRPSCIIRSGQIKITLPPELTSAPPCDTLAAWPNQLWAAVWVRYWAAVLSLNLQARSQLQKQLHQRSLRPFQASGCSASHWIVYAHALSSLEKILHLRL